MQRLKVYFADFWPGFQQDDNYFFHVLRLKYDVVIDRNPDVVFFSLFGNDHNNFRCKKIFYTGESRRTGDRFNASIGFDPDSGSNVCLPLWVLYIDWFNRPYPNTCNPSFLVPLDSITRFNLIEKTGFCNFVYGNDSGPRCEFFDKLSEYKRVDSAGNLRNNIGHTLSGDEKAKIDFMKTHKFSIAFENTINPGYVTEKILHAFAASSVPIYYGDATVSEYFNRDAFLRASDYASLDDLVNKVREVDSDWDMYQQYRAAPVFSNDSLDRFSPSRIAERIGGLL